MSTSFFKGLHWLLASLALFVFLQLAGDSRDLEDMVGKGSTSRAVSKERQTKRPSLSLSLSLRLFVRLLSVCVDARTHVKSSRDREGGGSSRPRKKESTSFIDTHAQGTQRSN